MVTRHSLNLAVDWNMLKNPTVGNPLFMGDNKIERYLDEAELDQLLKVCGPMRRSAATVKGDPATEPAEGERKLRRRLSCAQSYDGISEGPWCVGECGPRFAHANEPTDWRHAVNTTRRRLTTLLAASGFFSLGELAIAAPQNEKKEKKEKKQVHNNGQKMVGSKLKQNGKHEINKKNGHSVSVDVKDGKIAGMQVKHDKKGDVPVKKYKTTKKMAQRGGIQYANYQLAQAQSLGTIYIGYAYIDDWGYEEIYWFPYEMIYDGETGAIDYVPVY